MEEKIKELELAPEKEKLLLYFVENNPKRTRVMTGEMYNKKQTQIWDLQKKENFEELEEYKKGVSYLSKLADIISEVDNKIRQEEVQNNPFRAYGATYTGDTRSRRQRQADEVFARRMRERLLEQLRSDVNEVVSQNSDNPAQEIPLPNTPSSSTTSSGIHIVDFSGTPTNTPQGTVRPSFRWTNPVRQGEVRREEEE